MSRITQIVVLAFFALFFCGCKAHVRTNETCKEKFTMAQSLALAIDPYATGPEAERVRKEAGLLGEAASGPFAALAALKKP
jgi:hypothetical protein